jgi:hypothetical protein
MLNTIHNVDPVTVTDFGREWHRFDQSIIIPPVVLRRALLCSDLHCAQGSSIQRSSLGAELACGAAHKTLTRCRRH